MSIYFLEETELFQIEFFTCFCTYFADPFCKSKRFLLYSRQILTRQRSLDQ